MCIYMQEDIADVSLIEIAKHLSQVREMNNEVDKAMMLTDLPYLPCLYLWISSDSTL